MSPKSLPFALSAVLACLSLPAHAQQKPVNLPDGPGKESVVTYCSGCHGLSRVAATAYSQDHWNTAVRMMLNFGVAIPPDQIILVTDYLSKHFPERPRPAANIIPGPVQVNIREWQVPIPGSRPHDPLATRDGAIWYTGQLSNKLGRVDPTTGQIREYPLKTPQTAPHGLVEDRQGNIWFTATTRRSSASSTRRRERSPSTRCRTRTRRTRTRSPSIRAASCGSRCSNPT